jgi:dipeptidyl aminopeptidase/acylaminoacyl peptidase
MTTGRMNVDADLERYLGEWLDREGPQDVPDRVVDAAIARAASVPRVRPRPALLTRAADTAASLWLRPPHGPVVLGRPALARAWVLLVTLVILLLAVSLVGAGAALLAERAARPAGTIAFESDGDIWLVDPGPMAEPRNLTETPATVELNPMWSPDGQRLAYWATTDGAADVRIVDAEGRRERTLTSLPGFHLPPESAIFGWSPDGSEIAMPVRGSIVEGGVNRVGIDMVAIYDVETGTGRPLGSEGPMSSFGWSRDGRLIGLAGETDLYVAATDGSVTTMLTNRSSAGSPGATYARWSAIGLPAFAFDGREVFFTAEAESGVALEAGAIRRDADIISASVEDANEPSMIVGGPTNDVAPRVSPDGKHLAFGRSTAVTAAGALAHPWAPGSSDRGAAIFVTVLSDSATASGEPVLLADGVWPDAAWSSDSRHLLTKTAAWDRLLVMDRGHPGDIVHIALGGVPDVIGGFSWQPIPP